MTFIAFLRRVFSDAKPASPDLRTLHDAQRRLKKSAARFAKHARAAADEADEFGTLVDGMHERRPNVKKRTARVGR